MEPGDDARRALGRLAAARGPDLDELCERRGVRLLGVFGSATRATGPVSDLDVAVSFHADPPAVLELLDDLVSLTGFDRIDLTVIDGAEPVLRSQALVGMPLFEAEQGAFALAQMAAIAERYDTAWLRRMQLDLLAG